MLLVDCGLLLLDARPPGLTGIFATFDLGHDSHGVEVPCLTVGLLLLLSVLVFVAGVATLLLTSCDTTVMQSFRILAMGRWGEVRCLLFLGVGVVLLGQGARFLTLGRDLAVGFWHPLLLGLLINLVLCLLCLVTLFERHYIIIITS